MIELTTFDSPVGPLTLAARDGRVCLLHFSPRPQPRITRIKRRPRINAEHADQTQAEDHAVRATLLRWYPAEDVGKASDPAGAVTRLRSYFEGNVEAIDDIRVEMNGTPFQRRVWEALRHVPAGTTCSYGALAIRIGAPSAVRAVGAANGANPVAIIVPCHRVIGANGTLTGYGGGLDCKRWLLQHEAGQQFLGAVRL